MTYNKEQLEKDIADIGNQIKSIRDVKGHDYACNTDVLENVRVCGEYGVIVRCLDKLMRLKNINNKGKVMVRDESVEDTWKDLINYAYYGLILHRQTSVVPDVPRSPAQFGGLG